MDDEKTKAFEEWFFHRKKDELDNIHEDAIEIRADIETNFDENSDLFFEAFSSGYEAGQKNKVVGYFSENFTKTFGKTQIKFEKKIQLAERERILRNVESGAMPRDLQEALNKAGYFKAYELKERERIKKIMHQWFKKQLEVQDIDENDEFVTEWDELLTQIDDQKEGFP